MGIDSSLEGWEIIITAGRNWECDIRIVIRI